MAIPNRHSSRPGTYFLTTRTWESRAIFVKEGACVILVDSLLHYRDAGAYALHEFVLMPDHFHALLTPAEDVPVERAMQYVKGGSAHEIRKNLNFLLPVWQRGFSDHRVRDLADFETHVRYIHMNPVKRNLSATAEEYPWGSALGRYRLDERPHIF
jgi:putative transposase